ncbi:unnamed protein product [Mytilus edulis]|uniref:Uncharacterized protein n=1 Tax=Mytilus edulis TaxID=6550 RepID=A0A8S3RBX4_MYTED|nr:unnamed protein product [Mytilus edulis]
MHVLTNWQQKHCRTQKRLRRRQTLFKSEDLSYRRMNHNPDILVLTGIYEHEEGKIKTLHRNLLFQSATSDLKPVDLQSITRKATPSPSAIFTISMMHHAGINLVRYVQLSYLKPSQISSGDLADELHVDHSHHTADIKEARGSQSYVQSLTNKHKKKRKRTKQTRMFIKNGKHLFGKELKKELKKWSKTEKEASEIALALGGKKNSHKKKVINYGIPRQVHQSQRWEPIESHQRQTALSVKTSESFTGSKNLRRQRK